MDWITKSQSHKVMHPIDSLIDFIMFTLSVMSMGKTNSSPSPWFSSVTGAIVHTMEGLLFLKQRAGPPAGGVFLVFKLLKGGFCTMSTLWSAFSAEPAVCTQRWGGDCMCKLNRSACFIPLFYTLEGQPCRTSQNHDVIPNVIQTKLNHATGRLVCK